jgi:hypothetical protein
MQTLTLQVQDNFIPNLLTYLEQFKNEVKITKDKNLELDPYFYERQEELHKIRDNIKKGDIKMVSHEKLWENIKNHLKTIETK